MQQCHTTTRRSASLAIVATLVLCACSSDPELTAPVETLVEFEATLQCDITRFAYADAAELDNQRVELRNGFAISPEDHRLFLDMLTDDVELRDTVADRTDEICPVLDDGTDEEAGSE